MFEAIAPAKKTALLLRADLCGAASGLLGFVAWKCLEATTIGQTSAVKLAATSMSFAMVAGVLAIAFLPRVTLDGEKALTISSRAGVRSGIIAALLCSGLILMAAVIGAFQAATRADDMLLRSLVWHSLVVLLASLVSSVPAGLIGGLIGLAIRKPETVRQLLGTLVHPHITPLNDDSRKEGSERSWLGWSLVTLSVMGLFSPVILLFRDLKVDPLPVVAALLPAPPPKPTPPSFHYAKPKAYELAEPSQFVIQTRKRLPSLQPNAPIIISSDSRLAACCPSGAGKVTVTVLDLDSLAGIASFSLPSVPDHLAWSPELSRLFYMIAGEPQGLGVLNISDYTNTALPKPRNKDLPSGPCRWLTKNEVVFYPSDEPALCLNLESLALLPLTESDKFKALGATERKRVSSPPHTAFPETNAWKMALGFRLSTIVEPARRSADDRWSFKGFAALGFGESAKQVKRSLETLPVEVNDKLVPSPDGTKLIVLRGGESEVIYFGLRDAQTPQIRLKMPMARDKMPSPEANQASFDENSLCAFAYAPMVNPLTGKVIGPDREHVRSLLRLLKWEGKDAIWWSAEQYEDLREGDVVADIHTWEGGQITPVRTLAKPDWWIQMAMLDETERAAIPSHAKAKELDNLIEIQTLQDTYSIQFQQVTQRARKPPETNPSPPTPPAPVKPGRKTEAEVLAFIRRHHAMASARDLDGMMADYADEIDLMKGPPLTRAQLREKEAEDFKKWPRGLEEVESVKEIKAVGDFWSVTYAVRFSEEDAIGEKREGLFDVTMFVTNPPEGLRITVQQTSVRDVQTLGKQNGAAAPKKKGPAAVAITLPKPYWVGTRQIVGAPGNIVATDVIHLQNSSADFHRTFRLMGPNGEVLKSCRAEYHGQVTRQGNSLSIYIGQLGWGRDGDNDLVRTMAASAEALVGGPITLDITGNNLTVSGTNEVLRPQ